MILGIPSSYASYVYKTFIETLAEETDIDVKWSGKTDRDTLNGKGALCVDEACLPVKISCAHAQKLEKESDFLAVPRIMKTEYGESVCPKVAGLPDIIGATLPKEKLLFTEKLELNDPIGLRKALWRNCHKMKVGKKAFIKAYEKAVKAQREAKRGLDERCYLYRVFLAGHPYNIYDEYINLGLINKLHKANIGVVTEETVSRKEKTDILAKENLIKKPYWSYFVNLYGSIKALENDIDGVVYVSSFSCGTDAFTVEMIKNNLKHVPVLILKIDQQTGEAGYDTRLEAFAEILERKKENKIASCDFPTFGAGISDSGNCFQRVGNTVRDTACEQ